MTRLLKTDEHLVELVKAPGYGYMLTIARKQDGHCLAFFGKDVGKGFREALVKYGPEKTLGSYIRAGRDEWKPLYKQYAILRILQGA
jgi:hypothetical protein